MKWHLSFLNFSDCISHKPSVFEASDIDAAKSKVEHFSEVEIGFISKRLNDGLYDPATSAWTEHLFKVHVTYKAQKQLVAVGLLMPLAHHKANERDSVNGGETSNAALLIWDIEMSVRSNLTVEQIRERIFREYDVWIIEEYFRRKRDRRKREKDTLRDALQNSNIPKV